MTSFEYVDVEEKVVSTVKKVRVDLSFKECAVLAALVGSVDYSKSENADEIVRLQNIFVKIAQDTYDEVGYYVMTDPDYIVLHQD